VQQISKNVYVNIANRGANTSFVTTREGVVMIESPMVPEDSLKWRDEINKHGEVKYLINTEPHQDHFSGNYFFGGTVVGHEGTRQGILAASVDQLKGMLKMAAPGTEFDKDFHFRPPTLTLTQRMTIYLGDASFILINLPGHTPFEVAVYVPEERVVFTGDNVVNGTMPFLHQAVPYAWLDSLKELQQLDVDYIVPGHGNVCDKSYLPEMSANVKSWIDVVEHAIDQGLTLEEAKKSINMLDQYPAAEREWMAWVQGINIDNLYNVLKKKS
jgi:cyclase